MSERTRIQAKRPTVRQETVPTQLPTLNRIGNSTSSMLPVQARFEHDFRRLPVSNPTLSSLPIQRAAEEDELQMKPDTAAAIQRQADEEDELQLKSDAGAVMQRQEAEEDAIQNKSVSGGSLLPAPVRVQMENSLGADFSSVRVHQGSHAAAMGALAYARGENLHFQPGLYRPDSRTGQELLGHELTHVIQQRQGRVQIPQGKGAPINDDRSLESEADRMGARAALGETATFARVPFLSSAHNPIQRVKDELTDKDLSEIKPLGGGSHNPVYSATHNRNIGDSGTQSGYFKPQFNPNTQKLSDVGKDLGIDPKDARLSNRAIASSQLDKALSEKNNILAEEVGAKYTLNKAKVSGSVSAKVQGQPLYDHLFDKQVAEEDVRFHQVDFDPITNLQINKPAEEDNDFKNKDGKWLMKTATRYNNIDFKNKRTQKGMSDLQLMDALTGQMDRHGANIYVDPNGSVKGIDNDLAFGSNENSTVEGNKGKGHNLGLPSLIDARTAQNYTDMKPKELSKILKANKLDKMQRKLAKTRLSEIKSHIDDLRKNNKLINQPNEHGVNRDWGDATYDEATQKGASASYLSRSAVSLDQASQEPGVNLPKGNSFVQGTAHELYYKRNFGMPLTGFEGQKIASYERKANNMNTGDRQSTSSRQINIGARKSGQDDSIGEIADSSESLKPSGMEDYASAPPQEIEDYSNDVKEAIEFEKEARKKPKESPPPQQESPMKDGKEEV